MNKDIHRSTSVEGFEERAEELLELAENIREAKNPAYSGANEDYHGNFRKIAHMMDVPMLEVGVIYLMKHITAIASEANEDDVDQAEDLDGRFADAVNYILMVYSIYKEREEYE